MSEFPEPAWTTLGHSGQHLAVPLAAEAQQAGKVYRIGFLRAGDPPKAWVAALYIPPRSGLVRERVHRP